MKKIIKSLIVVIFLSSCLLNIAWAEEMSPIPEPTPVPNPELTVEPSLLQFPGRVEGIGTHFEVNNSPYLNIVLDSSESIKVMIESVPEMITMRIEPETGVTSTEITLSGFPTQTTFHKYEDSYENHVEFTTDEKGEYTYTQELSLYRFIFIQPRPSTKYIKDDATGGDCAGGTEPIGAWNSSTKTCTLNQSVNGTIEIDSSYIVLNGNGKTITGSATGYGIYLPKNVCNVTISNIKITNFTYGIYANQYANGLTVNSSNIYGNRSVGIYLYNANVPNILSNTISGNPGGGVYSYAVNGGSISGNTVIGNLSRGIAVSNSKNMTVQSNYIFNNTSGYGIAVEYYSARNTIENNNVTGNSGGIYIGNYRVSNNIIENNSITNNIGVGYYGLQYYVGDNQPGNILRGNTLSGNRYNFMLGGSWRGLVNQDSAFQIDIQNTNTIEGKPLLYLKNISNQVYDANNFGAFYCINCTNVSVKNATLSKNGQGIFFWKPTGGSIENNTINNMYDGIVVLLPSGFTISGNSITSVLNYGLHVLGGSGAGVNNNTLTGPGYYGMFLEGRNNETISANKVSGFRYGGIYISSHSSGNTISGNTSTGNIDPSNYSGHGIVLTGLSTSNQVTGNTTSGNRGSGIAIFGSNSNTVSGNVSQNNRGSNANQLSNGIYIQTSHYNVVSGNILRNNYRGIHISGQYSSSPASNNDVIGNLIASNDYGALLSNYANQTEFWQNNFINNLTQAYADKLSGVDDQNTFNRPLPTGGNYWSNWNSPDANSDGWVDTPYQFQNQHQDNYPRIQPTDAIAPTTTVNFTGDQGLNDWFRSNVQVSLSAQDNPGGFGLDKIEYSLDGLNWQNYTAPISFINEGINNIYYRSTDLVGNVEKVTSETTQIFFDDFTSFNSTNWSQATMLPLYTTSMTQNITATTHQGKSTLYFYGYGTSPNKRRGVRTNQTYTLSEGTNFEMTIKPFNSLGNRWGVIELFLVSPTGDQYARMTAWVSSPGTGWFNIQTEVKNQTVYSSPNYPLASYFNTMKIRLEGGKTIFTFIDNNNMERWSQTYNVDLATLMPTAYLAISQYIDASLPGTSYMLDAHVDNLKAYRTTTEYYKKDVKIDKTAPTASINLDGTLGGNSWYVSDITATISASDNNGIDKIEYSFDGNSWSQYNQPLVISEGGIKTLYYRAFDLAGNMTSVEDIEIKIDKNSPQTQISLTGNLGSNGWYISDVIVDFTAIDAEGGLDANPTYYSFDNQNFINYLSPLTISNQETTIYYYSVDLAGNIEEIRSQTVKVDKTPPEITIISPIASEYKHSKIIDIKFTAIDDVSGVNETIVYFDGEEYKNNTIDLLYITLGTHNITVESENNAGLSQTNSVEFEVIATIDSLISALNRLYDMGEINNKGILNSFQKKLETAKKKIDSNDNKVAKNILNAFINEIEAQEGKHVSEFAVNALKTNAEYIISQL